MNIAFIPVRGGSKSIPLKNIKDIVGKPLVYWVTKAANNCKYIDKVCIATDSRKIKEVVSSFGFDKVEIYDRSEENATDTASTESVMLEYAEKTNFDNIFLIQATSPLLTSDDLSGGYELFCSSDTDSVLSVVRQKRFIWAVNEAGYVNPTNYEVGNRPRRQDFDGFLVENGAFYITSRKRLLSTKNRISGNICAYEMDESTYYEIDELIDWKIIEQLLQDREYQKNKKHKIKLFLTDCDGCLTDGGMYYSEKGDEQKKFNTKDGMGFKLLREKGIITGIITGENTELNRRRFEKLKIDEVHQGVTNKPEIIKKLCEKYNLKLDEVAYVGDDINDIEAIKMVGLGCCVADSNVAVKQVASVISKSKGGEGAVREIIEYVLYGR